MSSSNLIRWGGLAAMVAGVAFILDILFVLTVDADWTNVVYIVAALLLVIGMVGLHSLQKDNYGRIGRGGFWTVVVATLGQVLGIIVFLLGSPQLARVPGGLLGRARRTHSVRCCYLAGESATALVRVGAHHRPTSNGSFGRLRRDSVRSVMAGAGLRALVAGGRGSRATLPRELDNPAA